jgi:hypothetical protein
MTINHIGTPTARWGKTERRRRETAHWRVDEKHNRSATNPKASGTSLVNTRIFDCGSFTETNSDYAATAAGLSYSSTLMFAVKSYPTAAMRPFGRLPFCQMPVIATIVKRAVKNQIVQPADGGTTYESYTYSCGDRMTERRMPKSS